MIDYNIKFYKTLHLLVIILLFLPYTIFSQMDWSLPLKPCWSINESTTLIASDNVSQTAILFSTNSIKSINHKTGQTNWENKKDSQFYSDITIYKNFVFFTEINTTNEKKFIHLIDIYSGLSIWRKEISNNSSVYLYSNENKVLIKGKDKIFFNLETGQEIFKDNSLSTYFEIFSLDRGFFPNVNEQLETLTFQGKIIRNFEFMNQKLQVLIPFKTNNFVWTTDGNYLGLYDSVLEKIIWRRKIGGRINDIKLSENTIYISSFDNFIYLFSKTDGKFLLKRRLDGRVTNSSEIYDNRIAVSAYNSKSIVIVNLKKNSVENQLTLSDADSFSIHQSFIEDKLIVATPSKVIAFSPRCK